MRSVRGFTLLELMISLFVGGLILGGVMLTYLSMKTTTRDTLTIGELQESGRLVLSILQRDIEQIGFWGTFYDAGFTETNLSSPANPGNDCTDGFNNGSFPNADPANFRAIYGSTITSGRALGCITNAKANTEVLQLKFLEGFQVLAQATANTNRYYFVAEQEKGQFVPGNTARTMALNVNATLWPYSHHVYYIKEINYVLNDQNVSVPVLYRRRLTVSGGMIDEPVMEGVEDIRLLFGLDTTADGRVNLYRPLSSMQATDWENEDAILTVQLFILVRALEPDAGLSLTNQTYSLGHDPQKRTLTFKDSYRRTVFSTTIRLNNMGANQWRL
ncbi:PilW family protein [Pseudoalteromonas fenneropenaei]|uniref:PilW family protein n=1 Tax=Pseudoalteromonas fenneropenaei TaxID=1737459 RepID=A0ABV7CMZ1_9GAMM